jgi:hypothetical protein
MDPERKSEACMKIQRSSFLIVAVLAVVLSGTAALAQSPAATVNVPFAFSVAGKELPAGKYEIRSEGADKNYLAIRGTTGGNILASFETRLADLGFKDVQVVFDKEDGKYYLSEVHYPGVDGFAFKGAPGKHTHEKVGGM